MSLTGISNLSKEAIRTRIHDELVAYFKGSYTVEEWAVWKDFLDKSDAKVLTEAVEKFIQQAPASSWVPTLKEISAAVNSIYNNRAIKEAEQRSATACNECGGTTWNKVSKNLAFPCSQCLPEAFNRWMDNRYEPFGFLLDDSELTGPAPDANYQPPIPPKTSGGTTVSGERARQYEDFIKNGNGHETIAEYELERLEALQNEQ